MTDDILTRDTDGNLAVRTVSSTGDNYVNPDDVYTRDSDGKLCVRVTGQGGGGDQHNLGYFATQAALEEAYPTAEAGDWAIVGATDTVWIWDTDTSAWKDSDQKGQVTSVNNQTGAVTLGINEVAPTQTDKSGYVLGTDGFVAGWVKPEIVQRSALPAASEDEVGNIYEYVGTTDANYTNGYFYKNVATAAEATASQTYGSGLTDISVTNISTFASAFETGFNTSIFDTTVDFEYDGTAWMVSTEIEGQTESLLDQDITDWAVTFTGTPQEGDTISVVYTGASYSWTQVNVQPAPVIPDPLPSQTGNAGKLLTTNGTEASWVTVINDNSTSSLTETWSASKLNTVIGNIETLLSQI